MPDGKTVDPVTGGPTLTERELLCGLINLVASAAHRLTGEKVETVGVIDRHGRETGCRPSTWCVSWGESPTVPSDVFDQVRVPTLLTASSAVPECAASVALAARNDAPTQGEVMLLLANVVTALVERVTGDRVALRVTTFKGHPFALIPDPGQVTWGVLPAPPGRDVETLEPTATPLVLPPSPGATLPELSSTDRATATRPG